MPSAADACRLHGVLLDIAITAGQRRRSVPIIGTDGDVALRRAFCADRVFLGGADRQLFR
ncbi:MAG: hypothetical protein JWN62_1839 [Acidimicrobiales bacterium]|nr:hypothetical protein [Acidimicrobiales bacterium]